MGYIQKNIIYFVVGLFLFTLVADGFLFGPLKMAQGSAIQSESEFIINGEEVVKVKTPTAGSPLRGSGARLGEASALVVGGGADLSCQNLPVEMWIFILLAFIFLLIFNLAYDFAKAKKIQWGWEIILLLLTLWVWFVFDQCRTMIWFPLYTIKLGLIIYLAYLYFFEKKPKIKEEGEQESLF